MKLLLLRDFSGENSESFAGWTDLSIQNVASDAGFLNSRLII